MICVRKAHISSGLMQRPGMRRHVGYQSQEQSLLINNLLAQWGEREVSAASKPRCGLLYPSHTWHVTLHYVCSDDSRFCTLFFWKCLLVMDMLTTWSQTALIDRCCNCAKLAVLVASSSTQGRGVRSFSSTSLCWIPTTRLQNCWLKTFMTRCCPQAQFLQKSIGLSWFCLVEKPSTRTTPALSAANGELNLKHPTRLTYSLLANASWSPISFYWDGLL